MRYLGILFLGLIASSCAHNGFKQLTGTVSQNGLSKFEDKKGKVVCYVYENGDAPSLSCLPSQEGVE